MLGWFISSDLNNSQSGVPILKDIPILGALFRSASKSHDRTELIVLIRPTVLPTPEIAATHVNEEMDNVPMVKQAEKDAKAYEEKQLRKATSK